MTMTSSMTPQDNQLSRIALLQGQTGRSGFNGGRGRGCDRGGCGCGREVQQFQTKHVYKHFIIASIFVCAI